MTTTRRAPDAGKRKSVEVMQPFIATPERISQYLELKTDEVITQLKSVEGRKKLYAKLMEHEADLRKIHKFDPKELEKQLETAGKTLLAKERYVKDVKSPEKKGLFRRVWESIKSFPRKHPIVTTILVLAAAAGGMYLLWRYLANVIPVPNPMDGASSVANEVAAPTGGAFDAIPMGEVVPPNTGTLPSASPLSPPSLPPEILANPAPPLPPGKPLPTDLFPDEWQ
jgi:hypothetical protein